MGSTVLKYSDEHGIAIMHCTESNFCMTFTLYDLHKHDTMKANLASCKPQVACFRSVLTTQAKQALKPIAVSSSAKHNHNSYDDRRQILLSGVLGTVAMCTTCEVSAIPLAPLGKRSDKVGGDKLQMPTVVQVKDILRRDLAEGQYFITGDLTPEVFADDCRFVDPTNDVTGLSRYRKALTILFDPARSEVTLKQIRVSGLATIEADWTLGGYLKLPWQPYIDTIDGHTVYTLNQAGLIQKQEQQWSISAWTALRQSFTPSFGHRSKA